VNFMWRIWKEIFGEYFYLNWTINVIKFRTTGDLYSYSSRFCFYAFIHFIFTVSVSKMWNHFKYFVTSGFVISVSSDGLQNL